jgi:NAD(P)-dependent dehydrogenase (short-subunit alcohol dehydrogenase family)
VTQRRVFLITAASGIGAETARQLARPGTCFYLLSRTESKCQQLASTLEQAGSETAFRVADLTVPTVAPAAVHACVERFGRLDALFSVAGISGRRFGDGPIHECTEEGWATTLQANATTQYRMCREAVKVMLGQERNQQGERGVILNMSSVLALRPDRKHFATVAYAASKGAIISMSRSMAAYYASEGIRVNAVAPALVRTPMSSRASDDPAVVEYMRIRQPLLRDVISVEDVGAACVFLLTNASHAITGQVLEVDAGWGLA